MKMMVATTINRNIFHYLCDAGNFMLQLKGSIINAILLFVGTYIFGDKAFLTALAILIVWDFITGGWLAIKRKEFKFGLFFRKTIEKVVLYFIFMSAFWVVMNIQVSTGEKPLFWIDWVGYSWLAANEVSSIVKNIALIRPRLIPSWIINKFKLFDKTGKFEED